VTTLIKLITHHGFIFATSIAMFVHSTWTFNTLFAGEQPVLDGTLAAWVPYLLWVTPGALIAAAIDIGQVQTSSKLMRASGWTRRIALSVTFVVLAIAGYYLQWFHLVHHMPALSFGEGLAPATQDAVRTARDAAIYIIPALLPISTILYTMSEIGEHSEPGTPAVPMIQIDRVNTENALAPVKSDFAELPERLQADEDITEYTAECDACGWTKEYDNAESARRGLATHLSRHCTAQVPEYSMNGAHGG